MFKDSWRFESFDPEKHDRETARVKNGNKRNADTGNRYSSFCEYDDDLNDKFLEDFKKYNPQADTIEIRSKITWMSAPVYCRCMVCNKYWQPIAQELVRPTGATGCPKCASMARGKKGAEARYNK